MLFKLPKQNMLFIMHLNIRDPSDTHEVERAQQDLSEDVL